MMSSHIDVTMPSHDYVESESSKAMSVSDASEPLHIDRPFVKFISQMPKGSAKCLTINPNARETQNYSIVEYMAQITCSM